MAFVLLTTMLSPSSLSCADLKEQTLHYLRPFTNFGSVSVSVQFAKATRQWHLLDLSQCKVYVCDPGHLRTIKVLIIT